MASCRSRSKGHSALGVRLHCGGGAVCEAATSTASSSLLSLSVTRSSHALGKFLIDLLWVPVSGPWGPEDGSTCKLD